MAIKQVPVIYEVLKQTPGERPAVDSFTDLAVALKNAAGQGGPAAPRRG
jgi:flagellum-specific ATP synthase